MQSTHHTQTVVVHIVMDKKRHINDLKIEQINSDWLVDVIMSEFTRKGQNITPLRILEKIGIPISDQSGQLKYKNFRLKIKKVLAKLSELGFLETQNGKHDTLGVKEDYYKLI